MRAKIQKWGNSLAVRIPKAFATETQLGEESEVDVAVVNGSIMVTPVPAPSYKLEDLLSRVTKHNRHEEVDFGPPRGREQL